MWDKDEHNDGIHTYTLVAYAGLLVFIQQSLITVSQNNNTFFVSVNCL